MFSFGHLHQQFEASPASAGHKPQGVPAAAAHPEPSIRRMPSLSDSSATSRPATPRAADLAFELIRSDSVNRAAPAQPCQQPHSMGARGVPLQAVQASTEGTLAHLAGSAAVLLAAQLQRQPARQLGSKRARDEPAAPHSRKRQALPPAVAALTSAASLL